MAITPLAANYDILSDMCCSEVFTLIMVTGDSLVSLGSYIRFLIANQELDLSVNGRSQEGDEDARDTCDSDNLTVRESRTSPHR
jgi:hypothetical protein